MIHRAFISFLLLLLSFPLAAELELNPEHPQQYEVVKGDTLWDISGRFLKYPWHWPELWSVNSQIKNPHLIYPGDLLTLTYRDGRPVLELSRGSTAYKMSPEVKEIELEKAISTIPLAEIKAFLTRPQIVSENDLDSAAYIVAGSEERLISGTGDYVYARGIKEDRDYSIFSKGQVYKDSETQEVLGYEALYKGHAVILEKGDPTKLELKQTTHEILIGDRLLANVKDDYEMNFMPRSPEQKVDGHIISVFGGVSQVGQYQIIVIDRGERNALKAGHVISVYQTGETIIDQVLSGRHDETYFNVHNNDVDRDQTVTLPDEHAGEAMIFKVFEKVSYAIVMKATRAIHLNDKVSSAD